MKTSCWLLAPLPWLATLGGCTSTAESSTSVEISDSAGVRIVHSRRPQWVDETAWSVSPEPRLTFGALDGPEEYQLVNVASAARRSDGTMVVVDGGARTVRLYDSAGAFLRLLGGPGSGPGEFLEPARVTVLAGDEVAVWDQAAFRTTRFDVEGELVDTRTLDLGTIAKSVEPPLYPGEVEPLPDGRALVRLVEKTGKTPPGGRFRRQSGALRVSEDLSVIDTLLFFGDTEEVAVDAPWGQFALPPPQAKRTPITHQGTPTRICIGEQEGPEVLCIGPDNTRALFRWTSNRAEITREEVAAWREATVLLYGEKVSEDDVLRMLEQVPIPEYRPHYSGITLDRGGNLWVEVGPSTAAGPASVAHLVFDPDGTLLGTVPLPPIQVLEIGSDYVMGIFRDDLGIEYLKVFEIRKGEEG